MISACPEPGCPTVVNDIDDPPPPGWHWELVHVLPFHRTRLCRNKKEAEEED